MNIFVGRADGETSWEIPLQPPFQHWAVPIAVIENGNLRRVGTGFHFSRLGHLFSAKHCVDEALEHRDRGRDLSRRLSPVRPQSQLCVVRAGDSEPFELTGLPVQTVSAPEPTDLVCLTTMFQEALPQITVPLSFALPDIESSVYCFGFPTSDGSLFPRSLRAVEGRVKAYFPPGFDRGFMRGPCFLVDSEVLPGMSGGPVMNEGGAVCGVVSAGAESFVGEPGCLVTPIYPFLLTPMTVHAAPAAKLRINGTLDFLDLCARGYVRTDGTEQRVHFAEFEDGVEIGPMIAQRNSHAVFDSFQAYQDGRPSTPVNEPRMVVRLQTEDSTGSVSVADRGSDN